MIAGCSPVVIRHPNLEKRGRMLERSGIIEHMNKLDSAKRAQVIATLIEGCSVNSTARLTGVSVPTILRLLSDVGDV